MVEGRRVWSRGAAALGVLAVLSASILLVRRYGHAVVLAMRGKRTVEEVVGALEDSAGARLRGRFEAAGLAYPPTALTLVALKEERRLELWVPQETGWRELHAFPVLGASGELGPKLREGDRQVPEGVYRLESLNPNSRFHLSLRLDYPNAFDRLQAEREGRGQPGSDIFVHGKRASVGCLAIGDPAIEELFLLVHAVGLEATRVLIAPRDARLHELAPLAAGEPLWVAELYETLEDELASFR